MASVHNDPYQLERFVAEQKHTYSQALREVQAGSKRTHWMWFIFPQIAGLGSSRMSQRYALANLDEATAYLQHPVLGSRLREITAAVNALQGQSLEAVFGFTDELKFHSSMTLFAIAARALGEPDSVFVQALQLWFEGGEDEATLLRLRHAGDRTDHAFVQ